MFKIRRSLLFAPADRPDRVAKAAGLPADVVVVELEDGVAPERKAVAREEAGRAIAEVDFGLREVGLRVNRISTLQGIADILALAAWPRKPDLIIVPKVESAGEVRLYDELLTEMNADSQLLPFIESSRGLQAAGEIAMASPRITSLAFGIADLSTELGCRPAWEPMLFCRASIVSAGALAGNLPDRSALSGYPGRNGSDRGMQASSRHGLQREDLHPPLSTGTCQPGFHPDDRRGRKGAQD